MSRKVDEDIIFKNASPAELDGFDRSFDNCQFIGCDFSYADLSNKTFIDCTFDTCNLSLIKLGGAGLQNVNFKDCKLTGVNFSGASNFSFSVSFKSCQLDYSIFTGKKMKAAKFADTSLSEVDFTEVDLTNAVFEHCNLNRAVFNRSILKGTNFVTSYNIVIDPENNVMDKAKFSHDSLAGLLAKYNLIIK
ncbi:pentapeptide repeat-containing protein [Mucilaginibacter sp. Bleaf8]|uniref:pentapeptide repeat-containing protein n=1 Tax=Mucilaginibacter sp. Bleaf8 TaxID=2834430 RepID=UPI001BCCD54C|nr:pentapeptide repeat-containing protein [Mucilaginibacter sp. Bleaf8]MBS7566165.1 pentapeptide repeat-containing protein [Mucilaginibacter sp. Bleaf8]